MGVLLDGRPLRFEVRLTQPDGTVVPLHDETIADTAQWRDARVDLSAWAGQEVRLALRSTGDPGNVAFWANPIVSSAPAKPFNVIFMIEDAQRADYLSVYGHPTKTTPFKERLMAERGVLFEHAITQAEKTRPSAGAYMTGLYPTTTGPLVLLRRAERPVPDLGRDHAGAGLCDGCPDAERQCRPVRRHAAGLRPHDRRVGGRRDAPRRRSPAIGSRQFLEQNRDRNFFLYLHAIDPHAPYDPPAAVPRPVPGRACRRRSTAVERNPVFDPPWVEQPTIETRRRLYEAEIAHNDTVVEEFFGRLDRMGLSENTLVIMSSDHGEYLGDRSFFGNRMWDHRPPSYMAGTHVPMMFVYPKRFPQPKRIREPVQMIDLLPTVLELAGVDRTDLLLQGRSLVGLVDGEQPEYLARPGDRRRGADGDAQERPLQLRVALLPRLAPAELELDVAARPPLCARPPGLPDHQRARCRQAARRDVKHGRSCRTCWSGGVSGVSSPSCARRTWRPGAR